MSWIKSARYLLAGIFVAAGAVQAQDKSDYIIAAKASMATESAPTRQSAFVRPPLDGRRANSQPLHCFLGADPFCHCTVETEPVTGDRPKRGRSNCVESESAVTNWRKSAIWFSSFEPTF